MSRVVANDAGTEARPASAPTISAPATYRGFGPRPAMPDIKLFHGFMAVIPEVDRTDFAELERRLAEPFVGITTHGTAEKGLYGGGDHGASTSAVVAAARAFLQSLDGDDQRLAALQPFDSPHRRRWTNAFTTWLPAGLMLDDLNAKQREAAMRVVAESMSPAGFAQARSVMALNEALGDLIGMYRDTLREWVYWFTIFGEPSERQRWAWQLMGHHLVLNCFVQADRMILSPVFMGAEAIELDEGRFAGLRVFDDEQIGGLAMVRALSPTQRRKAVLYPSMRHADLPRELAGRVDGRHRAGAGRDNLVLDYEGISGGELDADQRRLLMALIATYLGRTAGPHAAIDISRAARHLDDTWFAWIGDPESDGPFYYRVHSPVILIEFDHHAGIFLTADEPQPFHVHTIVRFPNAGDYGEALVSE